SPTICIYSLSLHDALPIYGAHRGLQGGGVDAVLEVDVDAVESVFVHQGQDGVGEGVRAGGVVDGDVALLAADGDDHLAALGLDRSEEHTSELQSRENIVCR